MEQGKQESEGKGGDRQETELGFPFLDAKTFKGEFAFIETDGHFDVPTTSQRG